MSETSVTPPPIPNAKPADRKRKDSAPPVPASPRKTPTPSKTGRKLPADVSPHSPPRLAGWFNTSAALGYGVSVLFHAVFLAVAALWFFDVNIPVREMLISGETKVGVKTELADAPEFAPEIQGGKTDQVATVDPSKFIAPPEKTAKLPTDLVESFDKLAAEGTGNADSQDSGNADSGKGTAPHGGPKTSANAVTQGSFTVWTEPPKPLPNRPYDVHILVPVPKKYQRRYQATDLSGKIQGNDSEFTAVKDYEQVIPWDRRNPYRQHTFRRDPRRKNYVWINPKARYKFLPVVDGKAELIVRVPGAAVPSVSDVIEVESKILKEKQKIKIVFTDGRSKRRERP